jgi:hypothetical protein
LRAAPDPGGTPGPCEEPTLPADGTFATIFDNYIHNVVGPWSRCIRKDDKLVEIVKYRDATCAKIKADNVKKHWWE